MANLWELGFERVENWGGNEKTVAPKSTVWKLVREKEKTKWKDYSFLPSLYYPSSAPFSIISDNEIKSYLPDNKKFHIYIIKYMFDFISE